MPISEDVQHQYAASDPLKTRIETHRLYSERNVDLDGAVYKLMRLAGEEAILDVGCGPGLFPRYLRAQGHAGRLVGYDQSAMMLAEGRGHALVGDYAAGWVRGDATTMPFKRGFDWVIARHMLYHVSDIPTALREFARVLAPGGCVLATTNSRLDCEHIVRLTKDVLAAFGVDNHDRQSVLDPFATEDAAAILGTTFPHVEETMLHNAFIFQQPEPVAAYVASGFAGNVPDAEGQQMYAWLVAEADCRLQVMGGVWRDSKDVGIYICSLLLHQIPPQPHAARPPDLGSQACARKLWRLVVATQQVELVPPALAQGCGPVADFATFGQVQPPLVIAVEAQGQPPLGSQQRRDGWHKLAGATSQLALR